MDYRELMKKVERLVATIQKLGDVEATVRRVAGEIIAQFRPELGLVGGRVYQRDGTDYVVRDTFGDAKPVEAGRRVPRAYAPIDACVTNGVVYMEPDDPGVDRALEESLGVREFSCIEVGD